MVKVHELFTGQAPFLQNESLCIVTCSMHLTRCALSQVVCIFFLCFLKLFVFEAAIYANKDVYKSRRRSVDGGAGVTLAVCVDR